MLCARSRQHAPCPSSGPRKVLADNVQWRVSEKDVAKNHKVLRPFLSSPRSHLSKSNFFADVYLRLSDRVGGRLFGGNMTRPEQLAAAFKEAGKTKKLLAHLYYMAKRADTSRDSTRNAGWLCASKWKR